MSEVPTPSQKSRVAKIAIALVALLAGAGSADAAGLTIDPELLAVLKQLGGGGALVLILYLEFRIVPIGQRIAARDQREAAKEAELAAAPIVAAPAVTTGRTPRVALVRPSSVVDES